MNIKNDQKLKRVFSYSRKNSLARSTVKLSTDNPIEMLSSSPPPIKSHTMKFKNTFNRTFRSSRSNEKIVEFGITHEYLAYLKCDTSRTRKKSMDVVNTVEELLDLLLENKKKYTSEDETFLVDFSMAFLYFLTPEELFENIRNKAKKSKAKHIQSRIYIICNYIIRFNKSLLNKIQHPQVVEHILNIHKMDLKAEKKIEFEELCINPLNDFQIEIKYPLKVPKVSTHFYHFDDFEPIKFAEQLTTVMQELFISIPITGKN